MINQKLTLDPTISDRFHAKVNKNGPNGCWTWTGAKKPGGYGMLRIGRKFGGVAQSHRVSYELYKGVIPSGLHVLHSCDNPSCVNPDHLRVGTQEDNMRECVDKGRNFVPDNRGIRCGSAKLTEAAVLHIRKRTMTGAMYAHLYGVTPGAICHILKGRTWSSL